MVKRRPPTGFDAVMEVVFEREGGYVADDGGSGFPAKYGINGKYHTDVNIKGLTKAGAKKIYKKDYWDAYDMDSVPPEAQLVVFDAVVNHHEKFKTSLIEKAKAGTSPEELLNIRCKEYQRLAKSAKKHEKNYPGWMNRLDAISEHCGIDANYAKGKMIPASDYFQNASLNGGVSDSRLRGSAGRDSLGDDEGGIWNGIKDATSSLGDMFGGWIDNLKDENGKFDGRKILTGILLMAGGLFAIKWFKDNPIGALIVGGLLAAFAFMGLRKTETPAASSADGIPGDPLNPGGDIMNLRQDLLYRQPVSPNSQQAIEQASAVPLHHTTGGEEVGHENKMPPLHTGANATFAQVTQTRNP